MEDVGDGKHIDRVSIARPFLDHMDNSYAYPWIQGCNPDTQ